MQKLINAIAFVIGISATSMAAAQAPTSLSAERIAAADQDVRKALANISGISPSVYLCAETSTVGRFCLIKPDAPTVCLGNYYTSLANCANAKAFSQFGLSCFESERSVGQAYMATVQRTTVPIQNYFPNLASCVMSLSKIKAKIACLPSVSNPGQYFAGDLANSTSPGKPIVYYKSQADCFLGN